MLPPLTEEWIKRQLGICKAEADTRQVFGAPRHPDQLSVHRAFLSATRKGYPLVLREILRLRAAARRLEEAADGTASDDEGASNAEQVV